MESPEHNVFYIHGLGSNKMSQTCCFITEFFKPLGYNVYSETFNLMRRPSIEAEIINQKVNEVKPDIVIGSSLGGFYCLNLDTPAFKIVINPCMYPSIEMQKRNQRLHVINKIFESREKELYQERVDNSVFGIFGDTDELFNYQDSFRRYYGNLIVVPGKHRLEQDNLFKGLETAFDFYKNNFIS